jgi:hypothetical protein
LRSSMGEPPGLTGGAFDREAPPIAILGAQAAS